MKGNSLKNGDFVEVLIVIFSSLAPKTYLPVAYLGLLFGEGGSTNSVEDRGQRERGSEGGSPLVKGSTHFAN
jgi:hypothetical protein